MVALYAKWPFLNLENLADVVGREVRLAQNGSWCFMNLIMFS